MPDYRRSAPQRVSSGYNALLASAKRFTGGGDTRIQKRSWQIEAWDFYHAMGEFWYGTNWLANACSRVRLVAARKQSGGDEPDVIKVDEAQGADLQAVQIMDAFAGGVGGQAAVMKSLAVQLSVPGEGWVVGEQMRLDTGDLTPAEWSVKSADEIRRRVSGNTTRTAARRLDRIGPGGVTPRESPYEIQIDEAAWRPLGGESLVCRIWQPDDQYSWRATSAALPALAIMREIDLYNRRIIADLVSRLAANGLLLIPSEATFPVNPQFKDASDPFIAELVDIASSAIKNPGSAAAAIPIPLKLPADFIEKVKHLPFASAFDAGVLDARDRAIKRLAVTLNMPMEVLLGVADVNHWTAWQIDESGIKIHIAPLVEIICHGLTVGYLRPMLEANGAGAIDLNEYVVWYDVTELTSKPDLAANAQEAHADGSISDIAYRREKGFAEDDAPSKDELKMQILRTLAFQGNVQAIGELFPELKDALKPPTPPGYDPETGEPLAPKPPVDQPSETGPPKSGPNPPTKTSPAVSVTTGA